MYERGLNLVKLSELLGVSPSRVSDYVTGRCEPTNNKRCVFATMVARRCQQAGKTLPTGWQDFANRLATRTG